MKLTSITMRGYRRFTEAATIRFKNKLTAIIGPNEVGKTSVLRALVEIGGTASIPQQDVALNEQPASAEVTAAFEAESGDEGLTEGRVYLLTRTVAGAPIWINGDASSQDLARARPKILSFDRTHRDLQDAVHAQSLAGNSNAERLSGAWHNLCVACGSTPKEMAESLLGGVHRNAELENRWNAAFHTSFGKRWGQSVALPRLRIDAQTVHLHWQRGAASTPISWGSDGLRTFLALVLFLEAQSARADKRPTILLIDELEQSLHYGAQAQAVNMLQDQRLVTQVVYTTHSAGCLPRDIGRGVVALESIGDNESCVRGRIWDPSAAGGRVPDIGVWPLLMALGAGPLGFLAVRRPVFVEGFTDLLYLPEALRWASGCTDIGLDFYPGLSHACAAHEQAIGLKGRMALYWTDGDADKLRKRLQKEFKILRDRIVKAPYWTVEELLAREVFLKVAADVHNVSITEGEVVDGHRMASLSKSISRPRLAKERMAYAALEMADSGALIWDERYREPLRQVLKRVQEMLGVESVGEATASE